MNTLNNLKRPSLGPNKLVNCAGVGPLRLNFESLKLVLYYQPSLPFFLLSKAQIIGLRADIHAYAYISRACTRVHMNTNQAASLQMGVQFMYTCTRVHDTGLRQSKGVHTWLLPPKGSQPSVYDCT